MGRSWRNFFRRSTDPEVEPGTVVEAPEVEAIDGATPTSEEAEGIAAPVTGWEANGEVASSAVEGPVAAETEEPLVEDLLPKPAPLVEPAEVEAAEDEDSGGWFGRLRQGLRRSRESFVGQLNAAVSEFRDAGDEEFWERVEEILITSDVGVPTTARLVAELEQEALERNVSSGKELRELMTDHATRMLEGPVELDISHKPTVVLMVGVNGTGKTTTIGKLSRFLPGTTMFAAGDTFRAAAIEQLQQWGERTNTPRSEEHTS